MAQRKLISRMGGGSPHIRLTDYVMGLEKLAFGAIISCDNRGMCLTIGLRREQMVVQ